MQNCNIYTRNIVYVTNGVVLKRLGGSSICASMHTNVCFFCYLFCFLFILFFSGFNLYFVDFFWFMSLFFSGSLESLLKKALQFVFLRSIQMINKCWCDFVTIANNFNVTLCLINELNIVSDIGENRIVNSDSFTFNWCVCENAVVCFQTVRKIDQQLFIEEILCTLSVFKIFGFAFHFIVQCNEREKKKQTNHTAHKSMKPNPKCIACILIRILLFSSHIFGHWHQFKHQIHCIWFFF